MAEFLDKTEIDITCPKCGRKTKKSIGWIKTNCQFRCGCGESFALEADQFKSEIAKVERSVKDLQRTIKGLNKK
jgi:ribosomal protein L37AE/L43A